jgi:hypothetical protein
MGTISPHTIRLNALHHEFYTMANIKEKGVHMERLLTKIKNKLLIYPT